MANKPIIDIAINDEAFKHFLETFANYRQKLDEQPEAWKKLEAAMDSSGAKLEGFSAATKEALAISATNAAMISAEMVKATKAQDGFHAATRRSGGAMKKLHDASEKVGASIFGITKHLVKVGSVIGGLAGIGSLFGLDVLAHSAMNTERNSLGLGVSPGMLRSFRINMAPFVGSPDTLLQSTFAAKHSFQGQAMMQLALGRNDIGQMDAGQLATQGMLALHDYWKSLPENMRTQEMLKSRGFDTMGFSLRDAELAARTPRKDLRAAAVQTMNDSSQLEMNAENARSWTKLSVALHKAGVLIESTLINQLAPLAEKLSPLTKEIGEDIERLVKVIFNEQTLSAIDSGIKKFTDWIGSGQFIKDIEELGESSKKLGRNVERIIDDLGLFADKLDWVAEKFGMKSDQKKEAIKNMVAEGNGTQGMSPDEMPTPWQALKGASDLAKGKAREFGDEFNANRRARDGSAFLQKIAAIESGGTANPYTAKNPASSAFGKYQIIASTWARFAPMAGLAPHAPKTAQNQEKVAAAMEQYYRTLFHGNEDLEAIAWFKGEGVAKKAQRGENILNLKDAQGTPVSTYLKKFHEASPVHKISPETHKILTPPHLHKEMETIRLPEVNLPKFPADTVIPKDRVIFEDGKKVILHKLPTPPELKKQRPDKDEIIKALKQNQGQQATSADSDTGAGDSETQAEMLKTLKIIAKQSAAKQQGITIYNNSSANVARSANALVA